MNKTTKASRLDDKFKAAAVADPLGALATMFLSAFGVDLQTLITIANKAIAAGDQHLLTIAITSGVQIRNNVVFVGRDFGGIRTKYPELIIEGDRPQTDIFNFGALHALGHLISHLSKHALAKKALAKAGSCITGEETSESEAGKINKEISAKWSASDLAAFRAWRDNTSGDAIVDQCFDSFENLKAKFGSSAAPPPVPPPTKTETKAPYAKPT
jgi:hypothetical protein